MNILVAVFLSVTIVLPDTGKATYYDDGPGLYAAVPSFQWGDKPYDVTVWYLDKHVTVTVRDHCDCYVGTDDERMIDLSPDAFEKLSPLSRGKITVTVTQAEDPLRSLGYALGIALAERKVPDDVDASNLTPEQMLEATATLLDRLDDATNVYLASKGTDVRVQHTMQDGLRGISARMTALREALQLEHWFHARTHSPEYKHLHSEPFLPERCGVCASKSECTTCDVLGGK